MEIIYCEYCGDYQDYNNKYIHDTCRDWYIFILNCYIEDTRNKLEILLKKDYLFSDSSR